MGILWETVDRLGRPVVLTDEGWLHVISRHDDLIDGEDDVRQAVASADEVFRDRLYPHRDIHYRSTRSARRWLRVVVHYRPSASHGWTGKVITAHIASHRPRSEVLQWPSSGKT